MAFQVPILFIIFNRPDTTRQVFNRIREIQPKQLFIAADGPRGDRVGEKEKCDEARSIIQSIDWPCEVRTKVSDSNLGCRAGVSSAITWFFDNVDAGIILEDDCLPGLRFFSFCEEMISRYNDDDRVMHINGSSFLVPKEEYWGADYRFSRIAHVWGWATWRRAWGAYDIDMKDLSLIKKSHKIRDIFKKKYIEAYWINLFRHILNSHIDTWDAQWQFSVLRNDGITILPEENLVENIGFSLEATHTKSGKSPAARKRENTSFTTKHPTEIFIDIEKDNNLIQYLYLNSTLSRIKNFFRLFISN